MENLSRDIKKSVSINWKPFLTPQLGVSKFKFFLLTARNKDYRSILYKIKKEQLHSTEHLSRSKMIYYGCICKVVFLKKQYLTCFDVRKEVKVKHGFGCIRFVWNSGMKHDTWKGGKFRVWISVWWAETPNLKPSPFHPIDLFPIRPGTEIAYSAFNMHAWISCKASLHVRSDR